jgi:hypothetical protein
MFSCTMRGRLRGAVLRAAAGGLVWSMTLGTAVPATAATNASTPGTASTVATAPAAAAPAAAADAPATATEATAAQPFVWPLRSLRDPLPEVGVPPPPTVPEVFDGTYPGAQPFTIVPRKGTEALPLWPCIMCHDLRKPDPTVRTFKTLPPPDGAPHAGRLRHGKGRMWCVDCHFLTDRQWLRTLDNQKLDFDDAPKQCGQCHSARYRDWVFGGHGKRVAGWSGERQLYSCVHCHDPHIPVLPARTPSPPPPVRAGLKPMVVAHAAPQANPVWQAKAAPQGKVDGQAARP